VSNGEWHSRGYENFANTAVPIKDDSDETRWPRTENQGDRLLDTPGMSGLKRLSHFITSILGSPQEQSLAGFLGTWGRHGGGKNKSMIGLGSKRSGTWKNSGLLTNS